MTLQQKMLAKQSKKGFTLVELVVVIAILGILAAIAIPSVVGIINNAQNSSKETNAEQLTSAVKTLYSGVTSGTLTKETPSDELNGLSADKLPEKEETVANRKSTANGLTLQDAIDYQGLQTKFTESNIGDYGYSTADGTIYFKDTVKDGIDLTDLALTTTLGDIRGAVS